jgi:hypothetical protein
MLMSLLPRRLIVPAIASALFSSILIHLVYQRSNIVGYLDTFKSGPVSETTNVDGQREPLAFAPTSRP